MVNSARNTAYQKVYSMWKSKPNENRSGIHSTFAALIFCIAHLQTRCRTSHTHYMAVSLAGWKKRIYDTVSLAFWLISASCSYLLLYLPNWSLCVCVWNVYWHRSHQFGWYSRPSACSPFHTFNRLFALSMAHSFCYLHCRNYHRAIAMKAHFQQWKRVKSNQIKNLSQ